MIKVAIVDDNQEVRTALEKLITDAEGFELIGSYSDAAGGDYSDTPDKTGCRADGYSSGER